MYDKFFGSYLLNKKVLTNDQLKEILQHMQNVRIKIGTLAMKERWMNGSQVEEVNHLQRTTDKRFGELAVEKGYLTEEQVENILGMQSTESNLQLGQAAVDLEYINYKQLDDEMKSFEIDSGLDGIQLKVLEEGDHDKIVREFIDFGDTDNAVIYYDYLSLMLRSIVRFLDEQPWLDLEALDYSPKVVTAYQHLEYKVKIFTGISLEEETFMELAEIFAKMPINNEIELAEASVTEFLNLHNGIFSVNMSDKGIDMKLHPPDISKDKTLKEMSSAHQIGINLSFGKLHLILAPF